MPYVHCPNCGGKVTIPKEDDKVLFCPQCRKRFTRV